MNSNDLHLSLQHHFGFSGFREGQQQVIEQLLAGKSSLAIFPTGSGKSLCYQLAAMHLPHLTLVVSPLLALMKDQINFLKNKGIAAASIDSSQDFAQVQQVMQDVRSGQCKILMVSVERFKNERFRQFIASVPVSMMVVDEAHCISEWGHNFRPDYLKLPSYQQQLSIPQVLLLTATATAQVKQDMASRFSIESGNIVQTGFYRANLDLSVVPCSLQDKGSKLLEILHRSQGAGIIYVTLQKTADEVAQDLARQGISALSYHAGMDSEKRERIQNQFMQGEVQVIVATIAFGMGIDKSDIRFVVHYDLPKSIENYSQEVGRAGRDGQSSNCIILANLDGLTTLENFVFGDTPETQAIKLVLEDIKTQQQNGRWETQLNTLSNLSNIRQLPLKTLLVQMELLNLLTPKFAYFAEFKLRFIHSVEEILTHFDADRQRFLSTIFSYSPVKKVWATLDMNSLLSEQNVDRNRVVAALDYLAEKGMIELQSKQNTEVFEVNSVAVQDTQLADILSQYFTDKEQKEISRIAALVAFFQTDRCLHNSLASYFDDQLAPAQCGHCSVCRGEVATLSQSAQPSVPEQENIVRACHTLKEHISVKLDISAGLETYCRFLAGITSPILTRVRAKSLNGYNLCANMRYQQIRQAVSEIDL